MTETDSSEINKFIFDDALNKGTVFDLYQDFCEIRRNRIVDFVDFEFKYYQLYHGTQGERSSLKISDLPTDVLGKVVGKLPLINRLVLRKVSHDFRNLVDSSEAHCEKIDFKFGDCDLKIESENVHLCYEKIDEESCWTTSIQSNTRWKKIKDNQNFKQAMLADVATMLKNPQLKIGHIKLQNTDDDSWTQFLELLKSLNFKLNVRSIEIKNSKWIIPLLQFLNPDKLEEIILGFLEINEFNELVETNSAILKNPKLMIRPIVFRNFSDASLAKYLEILKSPDSHHNFRLICIKDGRWIDPILQSLNPKIVEDVIFDQVPFTADQFNEICEMEEWKKKTRLARCRIPVFGLEHFRGFKAFETIEFKINDDNLVKIRDIILKCPHLESCRLFDRNFDGWEDEAYEQLDRVMSESPLYNVQTHRMSIPNSRDYFQLINTKLHGLHLMITKMSEN